MKVLDYLIKLISYLYKLLIWAFRLWPLWAMLAMLAIIGIQCLFLNYFPCSHVLKYKIIAFYSQIIGGIIVLISINSNISVINKSTLMRTIWSLFATFRSERPIFNLPTISISANIIEGNDNVSSYCGVSINPQNNDEQIAYFLEQLSIIKTTIDKNLQDTNIKINELNDKLDGKIINTESNLRVLSSKLSDIATGGLRLQLFGILLMVNGAIASFF